jgi:hypothetical protein
MKDKSILKIAIVHDFIVGGGDGLVVGALCVNFIRSYPRI